ncbi:hypothetical protein SL053_000832 [Flavobacterium psychrophilum]|uniref:Uncharacterized protein n=3 Tax=Flavobacterium psychrophilum TaxID=96345 RepID=A0A075S5N9_FLAPS|nr:hypothetical protein [Flavobacterium psychrophilum]AIG30560.1 hypothetical protein IA03_08790 [Flavobacterium psychrophilum]AIG32835.1 hypothetical protein IA01_08815 [Flavobacterium psychrophilum]AIG34990.1 hypothetical protein IA02_08200 [Flavobacterium psychrophilum]AIG37355.1 hypothetical protein IA04_08725 [Flavobacterium psychrophilum]AIG39619.1 hypothetical protein IA05_08790 [Flavobacterium psychrophilum]
MKKLISTLAIVTFLFTTNINAQEAKPKDKKECTTHKDKKTCDHKDKKTCTKEEMKSCTKDKKAGCCAKK